MRVLASRARPVSGLPMIEVDTTGVVDIEVLCSRIREALRVDGATAP